MEWRVPDLLAMKSRGEEFSDDQIQFLVNCVTNHGMEDAQLGALLMAIFHKGMTTRETVSLTRAMMTSGDTFEWPSSWKVVDKHSTGGVGDKVSLPLAPALAACGVKVPMISGRGLGHTGGTLDKLESIPGYRVNMSKDEITNILKDVGCCIVGQTSNIVPADKRMYAIRDVTSTVASLPLIVASIVSKKAAESPSTLVLDVKFGCGTFMPDQEKAEELAQAMVNTSTGLGINTSALVTSMNIPIGRKIGNSLEIIETIECLQGKGPSDLEELVINLGAELLVGSSVASTVNDGRNMIMNTLRNGSALKKFSDMIQGQGVDKQVADDLCSDPPKLNHLPQSRYTTQVQASKSGVIVDMNALDLALVCLELGAGRSKAEDKINHGVGVYLNKVVGDEVKAGQPWATIHHDEKCLPQHLVAKSCSCITIDSTIASQKLPSRIASRIIAE